MEAFHIFSVFFCLHTVHYPHVGTAGQTVDCAGMDDFKNCSSSAKTLLLVLHVYRILQNNKFFAWNNKYSLDSRPKPSKEISSLLPKESNYVRDFAGSLINSRHFQVNKVWHFHLCLQYYVKPLLDITQFYQNFNVILSQAGAAAHWELTEIKL